MLSKSFRLGLFVLFTVLVVADPAFAQRRGFGPNPDRAPSVFAYGFRGLAIGAPVGLSTGYLLTRDEHWGSEDWRDLAIGTGVGAVGGAAAGLGVGFYDLYNSRPGTGMVVLRDTWYGTLLGATVGLIVGTVIWIDSGKAEDVLVGGAWGTVIGAPIGTVIGFIEGPTVRDSATLPSSPPKPTYGLSLRALRTVTDASGRSRVLLPTVSGTF
jgi:hypothetical protein